MTWKYSPSTAWRFIILTQGLCLITCTDNLATNQTVKKKIRPKYKCKWKKRTIEELYRKLIKNKQHRIISQAKKQVTANDVEFFIYLIPMWQLK